MANMIEDYDHKLEALMNFFRNRKSESSIVDIVGAKTPFSVLELSQNHEYLLVFPTTVSLDDLKRVADFLNGASITFMIVQSDSLRVLDFGAVKNA
jgi:hypothetical protein